MNPRSDLVELDERDRAFAFFFQVPIELSKHVSSTPLITMSLIGACVLAYGMQILSDDAGFQWFLYTGFLSRDTLLQVFTSAFLHVDIIHLAGNMYFLYAFARLIEDRVGQVGFILSYIVCAIASACVYLMGHLGGEFYLLGASGAVSGILGMYFILFPFRAIGWSLYFKVIPVPALIYFVFWFLLQSSLREVSSGSVAYDAHIGGFLMGAVLGAIFRFNLLYLNDFFVAMPDFQSVWGKGL